MTLSIAYIITFFMVSLRLGTMFFMIPVFGGNFLPLQIRILLVFVIAVLIVPSVPMVGFDGINLWQIAFYAVGEIIVGTLLGVSVRAFFAIIEVAGQMISRDMGLMMAQQFDPSSGTNSNMMGVILFYTATILFFIVGGHHHVIRALVMSFQIVGIAKESLVVGNIRSIMSILGQVFALSVSIAAPFIAINFIITLAFGVLGKVAPKINVMLISFSFRIVAGLIILLVTANLIFNFLLHYSEEIPNSMLEFLM